MTTTTREKLVCPKCKCVQWFEVKGKPECFNVACGLEDEPWSIRLGSISSNIEDIGHILYMTERMKDISKEDKTIVWNVLRILQRRLYDVMRS